MIASWSCGAHTAAQVSGSFARTTPEENAARNFAGMLSRFFASSECSKWPRNAKSLSVAPHYTPLAAAGKKFGPKWRSGRSPATPVLDFMPPYPTLSHFATHFPTGSVRGGGSWRGHGPLFALQRALARLVCGGTGTQRGARFRADWRLGATLLAVPVGGTTFACTTRKSRATWTSDAA